MRIKQTNVTAAFLSPFKRYIRLYMYIGDNNMVTLLSDTTFKISMKE